MPNDQKHGGKAGAVCQPQRLRRERRCVRLAGDGMNATDARADVGPSKYTRCFAGRAKSQSRGMYASPGYRSVVEPVPEQPDPCR